MLELDGVILWKRDGDGLTLKIEQPENVLVGTRKPVACRPLAAERFHLHTFGTVSLLLSKFLSAKLRL